MAFDLNPLALQNAVVLRALDEPFHGLGSVAALADQIGRDKDNLRKTLGILAREGLLDDAKPVPGVTEEGRAQLAALGRATNPDAAVAGALTALHADLEPHPLNPRKDFETAEAVDALDEMRESILTRNARGEPRGLMQPLLVRPQPTPGKWWIIDGERRFRAVAQAIWDGDWPEDRALPITLRDVEDGEHLELSLVANIQRANMKAIEEGAAFALLVETYGRTTEDVANQIGKSQRYVQQRIALLKLSDEDQDRMRLPKDHPDHLSFKAARALTQTPRAPDAAPTIGQQVAAMGAAVLASGEPGSSPDAAPEPPSFGRALSDREALMFVEIADKSERQPADDPALASEGYTEVQPVPVQGAAADLVGRNAIGFRQRGMTSYVVPRLHSTGAKAWLEEIGFYEADERVMLLQEFRARVVGIEAAIRHAEHGTYATPWLNPPAERPQQAVEDGIAKVWNTDQITYAREQGWTPGTDDQEPEQPALIEETEDERAAREARVAEGRFEVASRDALAFLAARSGDWMTERRAAGLTDYLRDTPAEFKPSDLAELLFRAVAVGRWEEATTLLAVLVTRAGKLGAREALAMISTDLILKSVEDARQLEDEQ